MLQLGQRLGDFEVIRLLGKGGMGEVYEAQQFNPPRRVALKVLAPHLCESEDILQRFWRESEALAQLDHPGIVRVLTRGRDAGTAYYTMQLIRGLSLSRLIKEARPEEPLTAQQATLSDDGTRSDPANRPTRVQPPPPLEETPEELLRPYREDRHGFVVRVGVAVARALSAAHRAGVLHRDLKPANMMLDRHGHLYLVDFGLARMLNTGEGTQAGAVRGTPWYMSPEQANGKGIDERSDVYSLGATLYELTTAGKGPLAVERADRDAVLREVRAGNVLSLRSLAPAAPEDLVRVIEKAMRFAPEDRYPTAAGMLADLERLEPGRSLPATRPTQSVPPQRGLLWPRAIAAVVGAVSLVLALGFMAKALWPAGKSPDRPGPARPEPEEAKDYFPWPKNPLPQSRRSRVLREPLPLLKAERPEPIWSLRLQGQEKWSQPVRNQLCVQSASSFPTVVLLDYDPKGNWYLYDIKVQQPKNSPPGKNQVGLVFGYRRNPQDVTKHYPCLATQLLDPAPDDGNSKLLVGTLYVEEEADGRARLFSPFQPFPAPHGELPLPPLAPGQAMRHVRIRAVDDKVTITVDREPPHTLNLAALRETYARRHDGEFDARGGVGLWVHQGAGFFADASVTPLPSDRTAP